MEPALRIKEGVVSIPPKRKELEAKLADRQDVVNQVLESIQPFERLRTQELFTYDDVAELLNVSKRQVEQWIASGLLGNLCLHGTTRLRRVSKDQLRAFVRSNELGHGFSLPRGWDR
ncbi:MAG: helix-turn-helix domain-containing protein [Fimbriimonadaceae bacterium]|nr:MAG: helix-turn-helix domain-containing protein [Fimbriimonadaceae bacterium]